MGYENTHWYRIPEGMRLPLILAIEKEEKLWLASKFAEWELQNTNCSTCPGEVERIWGLWNIWKEHQKTDKSLARLVNGDETLTRDHLEVLFYENLVRPFPNHEKVLSVVDDKTLKRVIIQRLYQCNVEILGRNKPTIIKMLSESFSVPERTLHRWFQGRKSPSPLP